MRIFLPNTKFKIWEMDLSIIASLRVRFCKGKIYIALGNGADSVEDICKLYVLTSVKWITNKCEEQTSRVLRPADSTIIFSWKRVQNM